MLTISRRPGNYFGTPQALFWGAPAIPLDKESRLKGQ
jgi:hypothetical protein